MHQQRQINIAALITRGTGMNTQILSPEEHIRVIEANDGWCLSNGCCMRSSLMHVSTKLWCEATTRKYLSGRMTEFEEIMDSLDEAIKGGHTRNGGRGA
jgi:hypothetical protein